MVSDGPSNLKQLMLNVLHNVTKHIHLELLAVQRCIQDLFLESVV